MRTKLLASLIVPVVGFGLYAASSNLIPAQADEMPKGSASGETAKGSSDGKAAEKPAASSTFEPVDLSKFLGEPVKDDVINAKTALPDVIQGSKDAPITVIEYASMTCGHCARFHNQILSKIKQPYIDSGKVKFIVREFPLDDLAAGAFMLGRCVAPEKREPLMDEMFANQNVWIQNPIPELLKLAKQAGLSKEEFEKCLTNQKLLNNINEIREIGSEKLNVRGTPTFFVNGRRLLKPATVDNLTALFDTLLKKSS